MNEADLNEITKQLEKMIYSAHDIGKSLIKVGELLPETIMEKIPQQVTDMANAINNTQMYIIGFLNAVNDEVKKYEP